MGDIGDKGGGGGGGGQQMPSFFDVPQDSTSGGGRSSRVGQGVSEAFSQGGGGASGRVGQGITDTFGGGGGMQDSYAKAAIGAGTTLAGMKKLRGKKKQFRQGLGLASERADLITQGAMQSPEFMYLRNYLLGAFGDPMSSPVVSSYRKGLQQAQASRGMYFSGASDEAGRVAGMSELMRMQLLPQLESLIGYPERFRQSILPGMAEEAVRMATGGGAGYLQPGTVGNRTGPTDFESGAAIGIQAYSILGEQANNLYSNMTSGNRPTTAGR